MSKLPEAFLFIWRHLDNLKVNIAVILIFVISPHLSVDFFCSIGWCVCGTKMLNITSLYFTHIAGRDITWHPGIHTVKNNLLQKTLICLLVSGWDKVFHFVGRSFLNRIFHLKQYDFDNCVTNKTQNFERKFLPLTGNLLENAPLWQ